MSPVVYRDSPVPLYAQIVRQLRAMVAERQPGDRFPTEEELLAVFGVSKMTIRKALQQLVDESQLRRVRGVGTFVSSPMIEQKLDKVRDFSDRWFWQGRTPKVELLDFGEQAASAEAAEALRLREGEPLFFVRRLRYADGVPLVLDHRFFALAVGRQFTEEDLLNRSIFRTVTEKLHIPIAGQQMEIWAAAAGPEEARLLGLGRGDPVMVRKGTFLTPSREPIWFGRSCFRGDMYRYSIYVPAN